MFLYISEITPANLRPLYITLVTMTVGLGMMVECILAMFFHWQIISSIMLVMSVANFCTLFMVPEPPMWLRSKGRMAEADEVDKWLDLGHVTGTPTTAAPATTVDTTDVPDTATVDGDKKTAVAPPPYWSLFLRRNVWMPTAITLTFFVCQQGSGVYVLLFYSMDVLRDCRVPWDSNTVSLFLSVARLMGAVGFAAMHRVARRKLVMISGGCMAVSLLVVVAYMSAFAGVQDPPFAMTLVVAFTMFMFFALFAILPMPWILCGEVFPMEVKGNNVIAIKSATYTRVYNCCFRFVR